MSLTRHYPIGLASILLAIVYVEPHCEKIVQPRIIDHQGYRTKTIFTNACNETTQAILLPRISIGGEGDQRAFVKDYQDSCCCIITSFTEHQLVLEPIAPSLGHTPALVTYKRVETCGCMRCSVTSALQEGLDVQYSDTLMYRR